MTVRFVIGRAGTGKTHFCLEAIRQRLAHDPVDGPRLILLVPEQASQQMERAILVTDQESQGPESAAHRAEVLSFQRLAFRVLESASAPNVQALTDPARVMVLGHLMKQLGPRMKYYRRQERLGGIPERLSASITELIQEGIQPEELPEARSEKLHDLALLYRAYLTHLDRGVLDPSQYLAAARPALARCEWLCGAELWVDGFASMSGEETTTLIELARLVSSTWITALVDPSLVEPTRGGHCDDTAESLFHRTVQTYRELLSRMERSGLSMEAPVRLGPLAPRFRTNESLARLEESWGRSVTGTPSPDAPPPSRLDLVELPSRRVEVEYAVSRICHWVRDGGLRYREVAIIARDLEPYHDLLSTALDSRRVPYFVDLRRSIAHHPLVELLRGAVAVLAEDFSVDSVRSLLKTGLLSLSVEESDELENYLLAHGLNGHGVWSGPDWAEKLNRDWSEPSPEPSVPSPATVRINASRRRLLADLQPWRTRTHGANAMTGIQWHESVIRWFEHLRVSAALARWTQEGRQEGRLDEAEEHRQVWRQVMSFLDDFAFAFRDTPLSLDELQSVLETGLSTLTLGLVPPVLDQVLLGAIERSRHPEIKAAVVIGFNDGLFPARATEDSILNDEDRASLRESGLRLRPPARERVLDESMLAYIALTRPSQALTVTYAAADEQGKTLAPSPYVKTLLAACPGLSVQHVPDPQRTRQTWDIQSSPDLRRRLAFEFGGRPALEADDRTVRSRWNEAYTTLRPSLFAERISRRALGALADPTPAALSSDSVRAAMELPLRTSVSQLESYASCPFQHFSRYVLDLCERADAAVKALDVGQVHHALLENCIRRMIDRGIPLRDASGESLDDILRESCDHIAERLPRGGVLSNARNAYIVRRSASQLARILRAQRRIAQAGATRVREVELPFGFSGRESLPALKIVTPRKREVFLRGFVDRVDLAEMADELLGVVIDYKHKREPKLDLARMFHGLSLQLVTYLLVLADHGKSLTGRPIRPIGGFFVSLAPELKTLDHPDDAKERDLILGGARQPRGLLHFDALDILDSTLDGGFSPFYSVFRKKSGELGHVDKGDAATHDQFERTLNHTRRMLGTLADRLLDGDVAARPFRLGGASPCSWCAMASVCGFEWGQGEVRFLDKLKRSDVFTRLSVPESR